MADTATRGKLSLTTNTFNHVYLAGVLDADGSICISKATRQSVKRGRLYSPRYVLYVNVVNTSAELMNWLFENFGGRVQKRRKVSPKHKTTYDWTLSNNKSADVLELIVPYLIVKKERAILGMKFVRDMPPRPSGRGARLHPDEINRRDLLWLEMKKLNQFGDTAATTKSLGSFGTEDDAIV